MIGTTLASTLVVAMLAAPPDEAETAFDRGLRLMRSGECASSPVGDEATCVEAIDAFLRAVDEEPPGLGALRNLGVLHTNLGHYASAVAAYRELIRRAPEDPDPARQLWARFAAEAIEELEPRVATLTVQVRGRDPGGLQVQLDGDRALRVGLREAVDRGEHEVVVRDGGEMVFNRTIRVVDGAHEVLTVSLEAVGPEAPPADPLPPPPSPGPRRLPPGAWALFGGGLAVTGAGLGLGLAARTVRDRQCMAGSCDAGGLAKARSLADASTAVTIVGGVVVSAGIAWLIAAKQRDRKGARR